MIKTFRNRRATRLPQKFTGFLGSIGHTVGDGGGLHWPFKMLFTQTSQALRTGGLLPVPGCSRLATEQMLQTGA